MVCETLDPHTHPSKAELPMLVEHLFWMEDEGASVLHQRIRVTVGDEVLSEANRELGVVETDANQDEPAVAGDHGSAASFLIACKDRVTGDAANALHEVNEQHDLTGNLKAGAVTAVTRAVEAASLAATKSKEAVVSAANTLHEVNEQYDIIGQANEITSKVIWQCCVTMDESLECLRRDAVVAR